MSARAKDPDEGATWKFGAMILAAGIGYVGFTGGKLQYPSNHYKDLNALWTEMKTKKQCPMTLTAMAQRSQDPAAHKRVTFHSLMTCKINPA